MAYDDRDYAQGGRPSFGSNPFMWLLAGRVPLFTVFGIRVVAHASMLVIVALLLLFGTPFGATVSDRMTFVIVLVGVILLHEFGHAFASRWSGGEANEIELTPLGGLALTMPGKGWWRHTVTVAGGPLVNVLICIVCAAILLVVVGSVPTTPWDFYFAWAEASEVPSAFAYNTSYYAYYVYGISYFLLLFNLLPFFPLDGGQLVQGIGWKFFGWYKATLFATALGMIGGVLMVMYGIASTSILIALIGISPCFLFSFQLRKQLKAEGPWGFSEMDEPDYASSLKESEPSWREKRAEAKEQKRIEREEADAAARAAEIDRILAKIGKSGRASLTRGEVKTLEAHRADLQKRG